ncbi:hypothetical protein VTG60DRAFT_5419 [Thermothelomyces hinnuleus]
MPRAGVASVPTALLSACCLEVTWALPMAEPGLTQAAMLCYHSITLELGAPRQGVLANFEESCRVLLVLSRSGCARITVRTLMQHGSSQFTFRLVKLDRDIFVCSGLDAPFVAGDLGLDGFAAAFSIPSSLGNEALRRSATGLLGLLGKPLRSRPTAGEGPAHLHNTHDASPGLYWAAL